MKSRIAILTLILALCFLGVEVVVLRHDAHELGGEIQLLRTAVRRLEMTAREKSYRLAEPEASPSDPHRTAELLKLRGEVTLLMTQLAELQEQMQSNRDVLGSQSQVHRDELLDLSPSSDQTDPALPPKP